MNLSRRTAIPGAFVLSFAVYLIPLFHLHAGWLLLGRVLASGLGEVSALSLAWIAAVLVLQGLAFILFSWALRRLRLSRVLVLLAAAPAFVFTANYGLLYAIPLLVLVEPDTAAETGEMQTVCSIDDASLAQVRSGADQALVQAKEAWLVTEAGRALALLSMPGCAVISLEGAKPGATLEPVAPGGHLLHRSDAGALFHFAPQTGLSPPLEVPAGISYWNPILSDDGEVLAWLTRQADADGTAAQVLNLRHLADGREKAVRLDLPPNGQFELIGARSEAGPFTLAQFRNQIFSVNADGAIIQGPLSPDGIDNARWGFSWVRDGWVAWDGYREEGRSRIVWQLGGGRGEKEIPLGRNIDGLSISADGRTIAVSTSSELSIGTTPSTLLVFRTSDGADLYRRYQPKGVRTRLAFLGEGHLAIGRFEGGSAFVDVMALSPLDG